MKTLNYWDEFMNSGKIEDYLSFKAPNHDRTTDEKTSKEAGYAGFFDSNGNSNKDDPYRGFR